MRREDEQRRMRQQRSGVPILPTDKNKLECNGVQQIQNKRIGNDMMENDGLTLAIVIISYPFSLIRMLRNVEIRLRFTKAREC